MNGPKKSELRVVLLSGASAELAELLREHERHNASVTGIGGRTNVNLCGAIYFFFSCATRFSLTFSLNLEKCRGTISANLRNHDLCERRFGCNSLPHEAAQIFQ